MRPVPLPALLALLLAAPAAACPYGPAGHFHPRPSVDAPAARPLPEGRCSGRAAAPKRPKPEGKPFDLREHPIAETDRPYWEMIGYRIDAARHAVLKADGSVVTEAEITEEQRPFDASWERLDANLWSAFITNGYRLDEATCHLVGPDARPASSFQRRVWAAMSEKQQSHMALETLLAKLRGLDPSAPIPEALRKYMTDLAQAGTKLPPDVKKQLDRAGATVGSLRGPARASYEASTLYFDGQRDLGAAASAALPVAGSEAEKRRRVSPDPVERELGAILGSAYEAQLRRNPVGRELLDRFKKGPPLVMVLKLTQSPNDPQAPGAVYDYPSDRMIINHWEVARALQEGLPPAKYKAIEGKLADPAKLAGLLKADPSLLPLIVEGTDVMYFHELLHAEQSRRDRMDDELLRGNLPSANPLAKEHEAHREHCRYLLNKTPEEFARDGWRDYCAGMLKDPAAFKAEVTRRYVSTYAGSAVLDDVAARQAERRRAARDLEYGGGLANWGLQKLKQLGFDVGDRTLAGYRADVDRRERAFEADLPRLRRERGGSQIEWYRTHDKPLEAVTLFSELPPDTFPDRRERAARLADSGEAWLAKNRAPADRATRLALVGRLAPLYEEEKRAWPRHVADQYAKDARAYAEELLAKALAMPPVRRRVAGPAGMIFVKLDYSGRTETLDSAEQWAKAAADNRGLLARIEAARMRSPSK